MMSLPEIIFLLVMFLTMVGALITVLSGSIIYALIGLVTTMFGIAGLYLYLNAPFIAMMQILIYVGAISILIAFAIMLAGPHYKRPKEWTTPVKFAVSFIVSIISFIVLFRVVMNAQWMHTKAKAFCITTENIGRVLFDKLMLPFELISLLIVVSIIGSIMLALIAKGEK